MNRALVAFIVALVIAAPGPSLATPAPLLVFVTPPEVDPGVAARLSLERVKVGLEASLAPAPTSVLGVSRGAAPPDVSAILARVAEGEDAWLRSSFGEADAVLRDALAWAFAHLASVASAPMAGERFLVAAVRLIQLDRLAGRDPAEDGQVLRALAWWGALPLPEDEFPPEMAAEVALLAAAACTGVLTWRVLGQPPAGELLTLGGRRVELTSEGSVRLPCGTWTVRRVEASGAYGAWERRVEVAAAAPREVVVSPRFERALCLAGERSLEVRAYPELRDDLDRLSGSYPVRALQVVFGPDGHPVVRDPNEDHAGPLSAPVVVAAARPEAPGSTRWAPWALYGLSVAALASGIALNVVTNGWIRDQNTGAGARFDRIEQGRVGTWACYGIAGATALAGAAWHLSSW